MRYKVHRYIQDESVFVCIILILFCAYIEFTKSKHFSSISKLDASFLYVLKNSSYIWTSTLIYQVAIVFFFKIRVLLNFILFSSRVAYVYIIDVIGLLKMFRNIVFQSPLMFYKNESKGRNWFKDVIRLLSLYINCL